MKMTGERFIPNRMQALAEIEHMHRYYAVREVLKGKTVLDAACGSGYGSAIISEVAEFVHGMDLSYEAVEYAKKNYSKDNLEYLQGSIEKLPFEAESLDVVVSFETIEHVDGEIQKKFLDEIDRVLKPDGFLIMSTPDKKVYTDEQSGIATEWHVKEFYAEEFHAFLYDKFKYVKWYQQYLNQVSSLVAPGEDCLKKINYDEGKAGKFIVAIASKKELSPNITLNSVYSCSENFTHLDDFIQLYYRRNEEKFSEEKYQMKEIASSDKDIYARIWLDGETACAFRVDILSKSCDIVLKNITVGFADGTVYYVKDVTSNANRQEGNRYYFYHNDPQIFFSLEQDIEVEYIDVQYTIEEYNINIYPLYEDSIINLSVKDAKINELQEQISDVRDKFLFEKGKNSILLEEIDKKEFKINELIEQIREFSNRNTVLQVHLEQAEQKLSVFKGFRK